MQKKITIKEIADQAGVSIATVSHVINRTRYVSPELVAKIEQIIQDTGYTEKIKNKMKQTRIGHNSTIYAVFPNITSTLYCDLCTYLHNLVNSQGYQFFIAISNDNVDEESHLIRNIISSNKAAGLFLSPVSFSSDTYSELIHTGIPFVCIERYISDPKIPCVLFKNSIALRKGTTYLLESGHKNILLLIEKTDSTTKQDKIKGYEDAIDSIYQNLNNECIVEIDLYQHKDLILLAIQKAMNRFLPTAVIAGGNRLTMYLLEALHEAGKECPEDISIIGFGDKSWSELTAPPLTTLERNIKQMAELSSQMLFDKINTDAPLATTAYADIEFKMRESTKMLDNGPLGEKAVSPDSIVLTKEEKHILKNSHFRVAISFHYTGTAWAELHEKGIKDELEQFGIDVVSVMDAHFDSELQNIQLEGIKLQHPDAVIAIPTDDSQTSEKFRELSEITKLVFISNVPVNFSKNNYVSCVSVNEWENGTNVGRMIGEYYKDKENIKIGFIIHGAMFYGTTARDNSAEKIINDVYPNIEIIASKGFIQIENAYKICKDMVTAYPEIKALYVSWDQPALLVIKALKELNREDISIFTTDLDYEIASEVQAGIVKGLSTQRPYEQGKAAALIVAKSLVNDNVPKYIGVQPYIVNPKQLKRAWKDIFYETIPDFSANSTT